MDYLQHCSRALPPPQPWLPEVLRTMHHEPSAEEVFAQRAAAGFGDTLDCQLLEPEVVHLAAMCARARDCAKPNLGIRYSHLQIRFSHLETRP